MVATEIISRYLPMLNDINSSISSFNIFLQDEFKIPLLDTSHLDDDLYFHILNGKTWENISFPRKCDVGGVYFYFGYSSTDKVKLCVYVGKASLTRTTGQRLFAHFKNAFDESGQIFKPGDNNERFNIEAVILIPFEKIGTICLAPALEEHIITELSKQKKFHLYNIKGKS